jgi:hypothetical protein
MKLSKDKRIRVSNMPGKLFFANSKFNQFTSKDGKQVMLTMRANVEPHIAYEEPLQYYFYLGDVVKDDLESVEAISEAMAVAWFLSNGFTYADIK